MTFPGTSVTEWRVRYGRESATAKGILLAADITYLVRSPDVENPLRMFKPLLFGFIWLAQGSRVTGIAVVLVQELCEKIHVLVSECTIPLVHEFDLWRIGAFWGGHWDEATRGGLL